MIDIRHPRKRVLGIFAAASLLVVGAVAMAAPAPDIVQDRLDEIRKNGEELANLSRTQIKPVPPGQTKVLQAAVMKVTGRAEWRADDKAPWRVAKVDDMISPGATLRTGRKSTMTLRVGHNATILVDRRTRMIMPKVVQVGETLSTKMHITRGRADFKVDRVGLTNDFTVVTPSTTLAVRGTALSVSYGGFEGTKVGGARTNVMFAIEISYFLSRYSYYMSGQANSSDEHKNPAISALFRTFGPPRNLSGLVEDELLPELLDDTFTRSPVVGERRIDIAARGIENTQEQLPDEMDPPLPPPPPVNPYDPFDLAFFGDLNANQITVFICESLFSIFVRYDDHLVAAFGSEEGLQGGFAFPGLDQVFFDVGVICNEPGDDDLKSILDTVEAYCKDHFDRRDDVDICIDRFEMALSDEFTHERER